MTETLARRLLCGASSLMIAGFGVPVWAQPVGSSAAAQSEDSVAADIVVTARRRDEDLQEVPLVVNVVTPKTLENLQIRQFTDIAQVVPGLNLTRTGLTSAATLRGVSFDAFVSGNNATVETYLNDTPLSAAVLFQSLFDIGQIEVLRGPQGTLRGRASPSGSITVTTRRPDLDGFGATASLSASAIGNYNVQGSVNAAVIPGVLAVRVAGFNDDLGGRVRSINSGVHPFEHSWGGRASVLLKPIDSVTLFGMYQRVDRRTNGFAQVESANLAEPARPASPVLIRPFDRLAVANDVAVNPAHYTSWTWGAEWAFAGQKLNYTGGINSQQSGPPAFANGSDTGNFFDASYPQPQLAAFGLKLDSGQKQKSHEIRLSSDERLFDFLDYVVGVFQIKNNSVTARDQTTPVFLGAIAAANPTTPVSITTTVLSALNTSKEQSAFASVTAHIGERAEITGGLRYISYQSSQRLIVNGANIPSSSLDAKYHHTIFSGSAKYHFTSDLMGYVSFGTSWRPGLTVQGNVDIAPTPRETSFTFLNPETSKSYEAGVKSTLLDGRLRLNATYYHQTFENYPYRLPQGVSFVSTSFNTTLGRNVESVLNFPGGFNFAAPLPAKIDGFEAEAQFQATDRFSIGGNLSYTRGRFEASIPCNDYNPTDGKPDTVIIVPTVAQIRAATGGDNLAVCDVSQSTNQAPKWVATLQSEYHFPVRPGFEGYLRGFATWYDDSKNDPTNALDDVSSYVLANAFVGLRDPEGTWDLTLFVRNLTNARRVLSRGAGVLTASYATLTGSKTGQTTYRGISVTDPREFGLSLRLAFGSR